MKVGQFAFGVVVLCGMGACSSSHDTSGGSRGGGASEGSHSGSGNAGTSAGDHGGSSNSAGAAGTMSTAAGTSSQNEGGEAGSSGELNEGGETSIGGELNEGGQAGSRDSGDSAGNNGKAGSSGAGGNAASGGAGGDAASGGAGGNAGSSGAGGNAASGGAGGNAGSGGGAGTHCVGTPTPCAQLSPDQCDHVSLCGFLGTPCGGTPAGGGGCGLWSSDPVACNQHSQCTWDSTLSACHSNPFFCQAFTTQSACSQNFCTWSPTCVGDPMECASAILQSPSACAAQPGCSWQ